ncbi:cytochrome P450 [Cytidiella melzeri]|nr:cytochrome P450 [Cytidiella melzeri]
MLAELDSFTLLTCIVLGVAALFYVQSRLRFAAYDSIPSVGYSFPLLSYITALEFFSSPNRLIHEGYAQHRDGVFKIPFFNSWRIVVTGPKLIDELRQAKEEELSFVEAAVDLLQQRHTMGEDIINNTYHIPVVRNELTKNIKNLLPVLHDELETCFAEIIPLTDEWTSYNAMDKVLQIIARLIGRVFVGAPICRDPDYLDLSITYTLKVIIGGHLLGMLPPFLRGLASTWVTPRAKYLERIVKHLAPAIKERRRNMELCGSDWADKPIDLLQWLMEAVEGEEDDIPSISLRVLVLNFASIHTSSMVFTTALYELAANPEYLQPLREEIEAIVAEEGWTKSALQKMLKTDSFIKECQRCHGVSSMNMERKAMKDFTFSDGTFVPKGAVVCVASQATHTERDYYEDPFKFDPWRFARMREAEGEAMKQMATTATVDYVPFGLGKHACPGRFFAVAELKMVLGHLVLNYDVKMENEGVFPEPTYFGHHSPPSHSATVMFRRRQT